MYSRFAIIELQETKNMTVNKDTKRAKKSSRTPLELAEANANRVIKQLDSALNSLSALRKRINALPSGGFSIYAKGFNAVIEDAQNRINPLSFEVTDKPEEIEVSAKDTKSFSDFVSESETAETTEEKGD
jgi:hypothetical protein